MWLYAYEVINYCQHYMEHYNAHVKTLPAESDMFLGPQQDVTTACIILGSDGLVITYFTESMAKLYGLFPGFTIIDTLDSLSRIVQRHTSNFIKIMEPPNDLAGVTDVTSIPTQEPVDFPISDTIQSLSPEMLEALYLGITNEVRCMTISPTTRYENGRVVGLIGTRNHIFTPLLNLPDGRTIKQYTWSYMDIWWHPEIKSLSRELAYYMAEQDCTIAMLAIEAGLLNEQTYLDPYEKVGITLSKSCDDFMSLLDRADINENIIQMFLEQPEHNFIISPIHTRIIPRKGIGGKYVTDFAVYKPDDDWHFIEIEHPSKPIYQRSNQEEAAHLTHAVGQVSDWLRFVDENTGTLQREYGLDNIYRPTGEVVAGRDIHLGDTARKRLRHRNAENLRIKVKTYDTLLTEARAYVDSLLATNTQR